MGALKRTFTWILPRSNWKAIMQLVKKGDNGCPTSQRGNSLCANFMSMDCVMGPISNLTRREMSWPKPLQSKGNLKVFTKPFHYPMWSTSLVPTKTERKLALGKAFSQEQKSLNRRNTTMILAIALVSGAIFMKLDAWREKSGMKTT